MEAAPISDRPVIISVPEVNPRIQYVCEVIFRIVLEQEFQLVTDPEQAEISYGKDLVCDGSLLQPALPDRLPNKIYEPDLPDLDTVDVLAWAFWHLTEAALYYDRPPKGYLEQLQRVGEREGMVEEIAAHIAERFNLSPPSRPFSFEITIDVDHPWKHRHKPFWVQLGGLAKCLIQGGNGWQERIQALFQKKDPYDIDPLIARICPKEATSLFFLVDGDDKRDSRFSLSQEPYVQKVKWWQESGFHCGLHPSYLSSEQPDIFAREHQLLENVIGQVTRSRQHYLRYHLPSSFQCLHQLGIRREYSTAYNLRTGFRTRMARPYPWFDLEKNMQTDLAIVPAVAMDRTFQQYLGLTHEATFNHLCELLQRTEELGGHFVMILHNETFSESGEWRGWRPLLTDFIAELKQHAGTV